MGNHFSGRIRLIIYLIGILTIYLIPLEYIEGRSFCIWYNLFGIKCFGCGMTRAFFNLSRLNFIKAIEYNIMIIPMIILIFIVIKDMYNIVKYEIKKYFNININKKQG